MNNIAVFQEYLHRYFSREFSNFYSFRTWKKAMIEEAKDSNSEELCKLFDKFGLSLKPIWVTTSLSKTDDDWSPQCIVVYKWKIDEVEVLIRVVTEAGEVGVVEVQNWDLLCEHFEEHKDLVSMFEKTVVLIKALRGDYISS
jgi:hypothetical protein